MPIDASIYSRSDYQLPERIASILDPTNIQERKNKLADLNTQRQMNALQLKNLQYDATRKQTITDPAADHAVILNKAYNMILDKTPPDQIRSFMMNSKVPIPEIDNIMSHLSDKVAEQEREQFAAGNLAGNPARSAHYLGKAPAAPIFNKDAGGFPFPPSPENPSGKIAVPEGYAPAPLFQKDYPIGDNMVQPHISNDHGRTWQPVAGSQPSPKFNDAGGNPYSTPVYDEQGRLVSYDNRSGTLSVPKSPFAPSTPGGVAPPVVGAKYSPNLQGEIEGAKKTGTLMAESRTKALIDLPKNIQEAQNVTKLVDDLLADPGFKQAVGKSSMFGIQYIPGTEAKSFMTRLNQIKGKQFLQAYETLKGGGQITEVEGKKATDAMSRMDNANTEEDFIRAAGEFKAIIQQGVDRAILKAQSAPNTAPAQPAQPTQPTQPKRIKFDAQGNRVQ